jgi:uncharacterized protein (DUF1501 family)
MRWPQGLPRIGRRQEKEVLILLELRGGNDGFNTVIPVEDALYHQARPTLAIRDGIPLRDGLALHPALAPLLPLWQEQRLGFALGVGWPQPSRSHFKAAAMWATGNPDGEGPGWLTRAYPEGPLVALGPGGCAAMEGGQALVLQLGPAQLRGRQRQALDPALAGDNAVLRQLLALERAGQRELQRLREALQPLPEGLEIPRSGLGQQVALALQLLGSEACPPVLQLAQGGYDTHANQAGRQALLLKQLAEALVALDEGLRRMLKRPQVRLITVSEFGRRLQENSTRGTDHGSASVALVYGEPGQASLDGRYPNLEGVDQIRPGASLLPVESAQPPSAPSWLDLLRSA